MGTELLMRKCLAATLVRTAVKGRGSALQLIYPAGQYVLLIHTVMYQYQCVDEIEVDFGTYLIRSVRLCHGSPYSRSRERQRL